MYRQGSIRRSEIGVGITALSIAASLVFGACSSGSEPGFVPDPGPGDGADVGGELLVQPMTDFMVTGFEGGPFSPSSRSYSLSNVGDAALSWEADVTGAWLQITGPMAGALLPGESAEVVVEVADFAAFMTPGAYAGAVDFENATDGVGNASAFAQLNVLSDAAGGSLLVVAPVESFLSSGPQGGPFTPASKTYGLSNLGNQPLVWSLTPSDSWIATSGPSSGSLAAGASVDVVVELASDAELLAAGRHMGSVEFANETDGNGDTTVLVELDVLGPGVLVVNPTEDFLSAGPPGGPFVPSTKTYQLSNPGDQGLDWRVDLSVAWLEVNGASTGTLAPGQSVQVLVRIGSAGNALPAGNYSGAIAFVDATNGSGGATVGAALDILGSGVLAVTPLEDFVSSGPVGGPFVPTSKTYSLSNIGTDTIGWSVGENATWLAVSGSASGSLNPGQSVDVVLQLTGAAASLTAGSHPGLISFTNTTNGNGNRTVDALLHVLVPGALRVVPNEDFVSAGPPGGPFTPPAKTYTLSNTGQLPIAWSVSDSASWLTIGGPASGNLNQGASTNVVVQIASSASTLPTGTHLGTITFTNQTNGNGNTTHDARLDVIGAGSLAVSPADGFQSSGPEGGPFIPANKTYTLSNIGTQVLSWSVAISGSWLTTSGPTSGTLTPGQSSNVVVAVANSADLLTGGIYAGNISFTNLSNGNGNTSRAASLSVSTGGWTDLTPSADSRLVYVSSSTGSDSNNGLSEQTPKATIGAGYALLRNGFPDWLQLREGDEFNQFSGISLNKSGRSPTEPIVITSYGTANERPVVYTNGAGALTMSNVSNIAVAHLDFDPTDGIAQFRPDGTNPRGVFIFENCHHILLEGCLFTNYATGIESGPLSEADPNTNIAIRRNVVDSAYSITPAGQGGFLFRYTNGLLIEENVLDHCGWNLDDPRMVLPGTLGAHAIYLQFNNSDCVVRGNVITWPLSAGMQCRSGGIIEDNFVAKSAGAFRIGGAPGGQTALGWVQATMQRNVALDGHDNVGTDVHIGLRIQNADGVTVRDNVLANTAQSPTNQARGITVEPEGSFGNRAITLERNIVYDWGNRALVILGHGSVEATGWRIIDNDFQDPLAPGLDLIYTSSNHEISAIVESRDNKYWGTAVESDWFQVASTSYTAAQFGALLDDTTSQVSQVSYPDPTRDVGDYMTSMGAGNSLQDFIDEALLQSLHNWRAEYTSYGLNEYIRAGFGVTTD